MTTWFRPMSTVRENTKCRVLYPTTVRRLLFFWWGVPMSEKKVHVIDLTADDRPPKRRKTSKGFKFLWKKNRMVYWVGSISEIPGEKFDDECDEWHAGFEICPTTGRPHVHVCCILKKPWGLFARDFANRKGIAPSGINQERCPNKDTGKCEHAKRCPETGKLWTTPCKDWGATIAYATKGGIVVHRYPSETTVPIVRGD